MIPFLLNAKVKHTFAWMSTHVSPVWLHLLYVMYQSSEKLLANVIMLFLLIFVTENHLLISKQSKNPNINDIFLHSF